MKNGGANSGGNDYVTGQYITHTNKKKWLTGVIINVHTEKYLSTVDH